MMVIDNQFDIAEIVYLITDKDQRPFMVISIGVFKDAELVYKLVSGTYESSHYGFEMSREKSIAYIL